MKPLSADTHLEAEAVQVALLRRAEVSQRLHLVSALVRVTRQLSWRGFQERHVGVDPTELRIRWAALLYGEEIGAQVADRLRAPGRRDGRA